MPSLKTISRDITRNFNFQFSTPTQDISTLSTALNYLSSSAAYSLIPGIQNTSLLDPERQLLQILPFTEDCMVDIAMPFIEMTKKKNAIKHYGRYIISNQQLIGIKIKPSDHWPKSKTIKHEISSNIENFYQEQGITNYQKEIPVGEFLIATKYFKIAPLFASEISSMFQNTTIQLLNDYYSLGCQVFSIVNDLTEEKKKTLKDPFDILKNYRRETTTVIYCGMHLALDMTEVYKTKSYSLQPSNRIKRINVNKLDEIVSQHLIVDLDHIKKGRKLNNFDDKKQINMDVQILQCSRLRIKFSFDRIQRNSINKYEEPMDIQEENQSTIKENQLMLYLWHIYVDVNKRKPFVLPCPMNQKDQNLLAKIIELTKISSIPGSEIVHFLKLDPKVKIPKKYDSHNFKSIFLQKVPSRQTETLNLYFSLKERMAINNIQKDETILREVQKKIINCSACISEQVLKILSNQITLEKTSVADEDLKFVEKFFKRKIGVSLELFYFEIAKYFPKAKITVQFLQKMFECLKLTVKKQYTGSPFQNFVLESSFSAIKHIFVEAQQKFFFKEANASLKTEEDLMKGEQAQNQENNFRNFIKKVKYHCTAQKKSNFTCHICNSMFHRKEKLSYGRLCIGCNNFVCYSCFDAKTGETAQSQENFQQCLICQNKCDCQKCVKKKTRFQPETQRSSLFRPSAMLYNSIENAAINEQENMPNGAQKSKRIIAKSQYDFGGSKSFANQSNINFSAPPINQATIKACWTCELSNRADRIIQFQCHTCKDIKCYTCQKADNSNRNWVLRGSVLCNKCYEEQKQNTGFKSEVRHLKGKIMGLEHEIAIFQRQKLKSQMLKNSTPFGSQIFEEGHQYDTFYNNQQKVQKGSATPIFQRSAGFANKANQSPASFNGKKNPSENGSIASFGRDKKQDKKEEKNNNRDNSSNSSNSRSVASKKSQPQQKQTKNRKNSSMSIEQKGQMSFEIKGKGKAASNSSRNSSRSSVKGKKSDQQSVESGQYQESSSSQKQVNQSKPLWKKNLHQNQNTQQRGYNQRGGYRGRGRGEGRGRGGNRGGRLNQSCQQRNNNKWNNENRGYRQDQPQRQYQNNRNQSGSNNKWQQNTSEGDDNRQSYNSNNNNNKYGAKDKFNQRSTTYNNEKTNDHKRQQQQTPKNEDENKNYYLGKIQSKSNYNDEDFDY